MARDDACRRGHSSPLLPEDIPPRRTTAPGIRQVHPGTRYDAAGCPAGSSFDSVRCRRALRDLVPPSGTSSRTARRVRICPRYDPAERPATSYPRPVRTCRALLRAVFRLGLFFKYFSENCVSRLLRFFAVSGGIDPRRPARRCALLTTLGRISANPKGIASSSPATVFSVQGKKWDF